MSEDKAACPVLSCGDFGNERCCDSCHEDEEMGYGNLMQESWLHACCYTMRWLAEQVLDRHDEAAVRALARRDNTDSPRS